MTACPFCGSDRVYPLLETLRCKRCKGIWKEKDESGGPASCEPPSASLKTRKRTDPLETRMEKKLEEFLKRSGGRYSITATSWQAGDISRELFTRYLKRCVKNRILVEKRDRYGRAWYYRPG